MRDRQCFWEPSNEHGWDGECGAWATQQPDAHCPNCGRPVTDDRRVSRWFLFQFFIRMALLAFVDKPISEWCYRSAIIGRNEAAKEFKDAP